MEEIYKFETKTLKDKLNFRIPSQEKFKENKKNNQNFELLPGETKQRQFVPYKKPTKKESQ